MNQRRSNCRTQVSTCIVSIHAYKCGLMKLKGMTLLTALSIQKNCKIELKQKLIS